MPARRPTIVGVVVFLFFFLPRFVFASNLLTNSDFENGIEKWASSSSAVVSISETVKHGGMRSLILTKEKTSWAYVSQKNSIEAWKYYKLSGWVLLNDDAINNIKLRFYWWDGNDKKSDAFEKEVRSKASEFQFVETDGVLSPDWAQFVDVQAYVYLNAPSPLQPAAFDDLSFEIYISPTPTNTPSPTNTQTPIPTATMIPTKNPTPTVTPTTIPTDTPLPSFVEKNDVATIAGVVLGETKEQDAMSKDQFEVVMQKRPYIVSLLFVGIGLAMLGAVYVLKIRLYSKQ